MQNHTPKYDAEKYKRYRPNYPQALFDYIFSFVKTFDTVWDCACGNGQASVKLADQFKQVIATDISETQIQAAEMKDNIHYFVSPAEITPIESHSLDLITVAQAYHWFDHAKFAEEAKRTLKPNGVVAVWGYGYIHTGTEADAMIKHLATVTLKDYWANGRVHIDESYANVPFPFFEVKRNTFYCEKQANYADLIGLLESWSPRLKYLERHGVDILDNLKNDLKTAWGDPNKTRQVKFPIFLLLGLTK